jgi:hypothetical protein
MPSPSPVSGATVQGSSKSGPESDGSVVSNKIAPGALADSPAEAQGRRILSTAFVRVGPDGHLSVDLRNGRALVLRDVVMRPRDYCGVQVLGGPAGARYCGGYSEVAAARPGGAPAPAGPERAVSNPVGARRSPGEGN